MNMLQMRLGLFVGLLTVLHVVAPAAVVASDDVPTTLPATVLDVAAPVIKERLASTKLDLASRVYAADDFKHLFTAATFGDAGREAGLASIRSAVSVGTFGRRLMDSSVQVAIFTFDDPKVATAMPRWIEAELARTARLRDRDAGDKINNTDLKADAFMGRRLRIAYDDGTTDIFVNGAASRGNRLVMLTLRDIDLPDRDVVALLNSVLDVLDALPADANAGSP